MNDIVAKIIVIKRDGTDGAQFPLRSDKINAYSEGENTPIKIILIRTIDANYYKLAYFSSETLLKRYS